MFRAVAEGLGQCLGAGEARHVASHLPLGLRRIWEEETRSAARPRPLEADELILRLQSRLGLGYPAEAEILLTIVAVPPGRRLVIPASPTV